MAGKRASCLLLAINDLLVALSVELHRIGNFVGSMSAADSENLGIAFALVCLAGLCAPLGACVVLFLKKSHVNLLAASIALAAGVMIFVSLTEVLKKSSDELEHTGWSDTLRLTYTYLAFFAGVVLCRALDYLADSIMRLVSKFSDYRRRRTLSSCPDCEHQKHISLTDRDSSSSPSAGSKDTCKLSIQPHTPQPQNSNLPDLEGSVTIDVIGTAKAPPSSAEATPGVDPSLDLASCVDTTAVEAQDRHIVQAAQHLADEDCSHLVRTSILVWLALALHNIPEGLATLVGYMSSPSLGVTVAVAIAIHNIPEGIALGVPIFFATGSKWKAIAWAAASGLSEPVGALIGMALQLTGNLDPTAMGIIMAIVAGVMTGIAFQELLPRALTCDPSNRYTTIGVFSGMGIMAISLILLSLWG